MNGLAKVLNCTGFSRAIALRYGDFDVQLHMKRWVNIAGTLALSGLSVVGLAAFGLLRGWHVDKVPPEDLGAQLLPNFRITTPEGEGPFPTMLAFHGCGGVSEHGWADVLATQGYAMVLVDSYGSRPQLMSEDVCSGKAFWGAERAGDVWASIAVARELPFVDHNNLFLMGWSHGGWAIADLLALRSDNRLPTNLSQTPDVDVETAIAGAILMYPYCGFPAISRRGWSLQVPSLMLLGSEDTVANPEDCLAIAERANRRTRHQQYVPTIAHVYEGAGHVFDIAFYPETYEPEVTADARERILEFMENQIGGVESGTIAENAVHE
ncbi:MAG: dienelactone hydrolase family protein [Synechococcus sp.]